MRRLAYSIAVAIAMAGWVLGWLVADLASGISLHPTPLHFALGSGGVVGFLLVFWTYWRREHEERARAARLQRAFEAALGLSRQLVKTTDAARMLEALQAALDEWLPEANWKVLQPERGEQDEYVGAVLAAMREPEAPLTSGARDFASSGTLVTRSVEAVPGQVVFTLRDLTTLYAIVIADRDALDDSTSESTEILLRVAVSALRNTSLSESLVLSERMAAMGRLARGVAHEVNNPLAFVLLNLQTLKEQGEGSPPVIEESISGCHRIQQIVEGLKLQSDSESLSVTELDLVPVVAETARLARARRVTVPIGVESGGPVWVRGDRVRIGQIVLNLMTNAVDACRDVEDPSVVVTVGERDGAAVVDVSDNGPGIASKHAGRLFEPRYTTKGADGSGLGLTLSRTFARNHGGDVQLERNEPDQTVFRLTLPVVSHNRSVAPPPLSTPAPARKKGMRRSVLVIDDERAILRAVGRLLKGRADVVLTSDPVQGLELARNQSWDLILCDLNMPRMSGDALVEELRLTSPEVLERFVIMTGSLDSQLDMVRVVRKPLAPDVLQELFGDLDEVGSTGPLA